MFKSIHGGKLPERATKYSAGFDVFANEDVAIGAGETKLIGLGICLDKDRLHILVNTQGEIFHQDRYCLELHPRSSLRAKGLDGGVGIIDMDYLDEIKIVIHNPIKTVCYTNIPTIQLTTDLYDKYEIKRGDKIGQLILKRHEGWLLPAEYTKDEERTGGFGSTNE